MSLSQSDREFPKCRKSVMKGGDGSDLSLSGSQVSLVSRPRSVLGKASNRALSVSGPRIRRPFSAVPTMSFTEITRDKRRPYSADSQLLSSTYQKRNKLSACFSMSADQMGFTQHDETDGDIEFSSSTLVSSQLSDQLGGAWMELEMRGFYMRPDLTHPSSTDNGSDLLSSEVSEDQTRSEKSLGECIQAMARHHVNHDRALCAHSDSPHDKVNEKVERKLETSAAEQDPKKMSTKELHDYMVQSGLIPTSSQYSSGTTHRINDASNPDVLHTVGSTVPEILTSQGTDGLRKSINEYCVPRGGSQIEPSSSEFWNPHHEFYSAVNNPTCGIDQISFPKEHDVDSLEGGSSCSNNGLSSYRNEKNTNSKSENEQLIQWSKNDIAPVRFQQWVTDSSEGLKQANVTSSLFCGVRLPHPQSDKNALDHDCSVEEVSTDSEYSKNQSLSFKADKRPDMDFDRIQDVAESVPSPRIGKLEVIRKSSLKTADSFEKDDKHSDMKLIDIDVSVDLSGSSKVNLSYENKSEIAPDTVGKEHSCVPDVTRQEGTCMKRNPFDFKESFPDKKASSSPKPSVGGGRNVLSMAGDAKKDQHGAKRRIDLKGNGSSRKCGKSPSNNSSRSFPSPKEETLPGESQTELLSWMALCTGNLMESKPVGSQPCQTPQLPPATLPDSKDEDSPYNEIMTILRVLEEKEDESSLLNILNKRSNLRSPQETCHDTRPAVPSASDASGADVKNIKISTPPSALVDVTSDIHSKGPEFELVVKQEVKHVLSKAVAPTCANGNVNVASAQGELRDLLTFLDAVDQSCSSVLQPKPASSPRPSPGVPSSSADSNTLEELLLMGRSELAQEIVSLRLALEDRDATINLLRTALREQKDSQARQNTAQSTELETRIRQVKSECEAVIKRHQKFIDQLIADKASLSQRCESLVQEAKESEEKHAKACKVQEEKHKVEMQRVKDITAATEKLKRERWVENKTQKIKELTVRGLEPELTRLSSQHEQEMSALRSLHAQELEQMEVRAARRAAQQAEALREQLVQEKEDALTRERDILRQRLEKQQLLYEEEGAGQRRRLVAEVRREQDRLAALEARLEAQFEERRRGLEREAEQERDRVRRDCADKLDEAHRRQQAEALQYREGLKAEKEAWLEACQQQQKQALAQATAEVRDQLKRERDREIEVVIERLESEATLAREEREKAAENRLRRVREQLTAELRDVESALNSLKEKHTELRSQLQEKEDKLVSAEALNRSLQTQFVETRKIADQLSAERADLKQTLQYELSNEMECLRQQLAEQHARHQQQLQILSEQSERERQTHQQELQQLFDRVKLAIAKKEEVVKVAKAKQKAVEEQNSHLQALLEHRRKESLLS